MTRFSFNTWLNALEKASLPQGCCGDTGTCTQWEKVSFQFSRFTLLLPRPSQCELEKNEKGWKQSAFTNNTFSENISQKVPKHSIIHLDFTRPKDNARKVKRSAQMHFSGRTTGLGAGVGENNEDTTEEGLRKANNAERDLHRMFARNHLSLPIPIKTLGHTLSNGQKVSIEYVDPSDWLYTLLLKYPRLLAGGFSSITDQLAGFWGLYRQSHPGHEVFRFHNGHLGQVLPIMFFGDEGRGPRRAGYMAATIESCLGLSEVSPKSKCDCQKYLSKFPEHWIPNCDGPTAEVTDQMRCASRVATNYSGNSYLTRFLLFGIPGYLYDKTPSVVQRHLEKVSNNLVELFHQGVLVQGIRYYAALVASKSDMKFQAFVVAQLTRSYANLASQGHWPLARFV